MEIVNTYEETLSHYNMKLNHAGEELDEAMRELGELELLMENGWQGKAAMAFYDRLRELSRQAAAPREDFDEIRGALSQLQAAIREEIRLLTEEEAEAAGAGERPLS
ncbi:MAG: hypothetical protein HFI38_04375 [Lachnospiraceae bacterium]|jgi:uncharacterized protein YukE|nr:hypothetical protein [Lachnospiraceae bacterium]